MGSTIDVKEEEIIIYWQKEGFGGSYHPFKDLIRAGKRFSRAERYIYMYLKVNIRSRVKCIKITFNDTLEMKLGDRKLSMHKALEPKEGEELRVIYTLPSPLTERSEINMSISPSQWYIEKISVIPASGAHAMPCSPDDGCITANAMCMNRTESDGITRWRCQCTQGNDYIEADDKCSGG
ncbi:uncharacterized protein LOC124163793 [Ischnura elegans]|uniref:uncharacterized protein LOC124163793 n=1 Tax=Ischnura elegans TaxID=197161 RepID=UPI001ED876B7|nr:uncharacterized protein LOC124163793 [Ischnura elegans]